MSSQFLVATNDAKRWNLHDSYIQEKHRSGSYYDFKQSLISILKFPIVLPTTQAPTFNQTNPSSNTDRLGRM